MKKSKLITNFLYSSLYQILLIILPLITAPYVSRVLGSDGIGMYSYTSSVASCFAMFGLLGVANYGNRSIAEKRDDKNKISEIFFDIWSIQIIMTTLVLVVYVIYICCFAEDNFKLPLFIQIITVICSSVDISWFFFGLEEFKLTVIRNLIIKLITTALIFILVNNKNDLLLYLFIMNFGMIFGNISLFPFLMRYVMWTKPSLKRMKSHFVNLLVLFIPVLAVTLYKRMDKIMLGALTTLSQTGFYENAEKIINIPMGIVTALGTVMMPRMTYLFDKGDNNKTNYYMSVTTEFTTFLSFAFGFGLAAISKELVPLFYGEDFMGVVPVMIYLSATIPFISMANALRSQYLIPKHYDKIYIISVWVGAVLNLVFNYLLIPRFYAVGAAIATVVAEASVMSIQFIYVRKELPIVTYIKNVVIYFVCGSAMFIVVRLVSSKIQGWPGLLLEILVGAMSYTFICGPYILIYHRNEIFALIRGKR